MDVVGRTVLVLGSGLVGTFTARALCRSGVPVVVADVEPSRPYFRRYGPAHVPVVHVDMLDERQVAEVIERHAVEAVALVAGPSATAFALDAERGWRTSVDGPACVARAARSAGARRLVFLSSFSVYGNPRVERIGEAVPPAPDTHYGRAKAAAEASVERHRGDLQLAVLRSCGVFGPMERGRIGGQAARLFSVALVRALEGRVVVSGRDGPWDEFLYVKDLARAITLVASAPNLPDDVVANVGTGRLTTRADIIEAISDVIPDVEIVVREDPSAVPRWAPLDVTRIQRLTGFSSEFSLADALRDQLAEAIESGSAA